MRQLRRALTGAMLLAAVSAFGRQAETAAQSDLTARTLYYNSGESEAKPTPVKAVRRPSTSTQSATTPAPLPDTPVPNSAPAETAAPTTPVQHLGVRYNVLLVDPGSGNGQPADPGAIFHANDCLALSVQSNYNGYLYVINKGSSDKWDVVLPSPEMEEESNFVAARTNVRAPAQYCFTIDNTPGVEHLFVVLARNPQDISELNSAVKSSRGDGSNSAPSAPATQPIETQMAKLEQVMRSRDLKITKVSKPRMAGEPANAVYVVDTSNGTADRLITEIEIKH